jgi:hypothetical protein
VQTAEPKRTLAAWLAAFALVVLGAKLWTIQLWATNIPFWDQWDEARLLFKPWLDGTLSWQNFFIPHNEHRIVFTRLLDLLEVKINGQWDIYFQTVVNAIIHIAYGCGLAATIWHFTGRKNAGLICFSLMPFFALPFAAENTIHGFQSQMYFVNIFSVVAVIGIGFGKPCGKFWFCGLIAAVFSIFTMASGFLAAAAIFGLMSLRALKQKRISRAEILISICALAVIALGLAMKVNVAEHQKFQAKSVLDFLESLAQNLAWPFGAQPALAILTCLPFALVLVGYFQNGFKNPRAAEFVLVFGLWAILQAAALAFGRSVIADSSRYFDSLSMTPVASIAAIFLLAENFEAKGLPQKILLPLTILWFGILGFGLVQISRNVVENYCRDSRAWGLLETENVRAFVATGDAGWLHSKMPLAVPYWNPDWLVDLLNDKKILSIMPADARPALKIAADENSAANFSSADSAFQNQPFAKSRNNNLINANSSVAIGDIKELGRFSVWAKSLVDSAVKIFIFGLLLSLLLAIAALKSPQMSLAGGGAVWFLVLLVTLTALAGAWCWRGFDGTEYAAALQKRWAVEFANVGHPARAEIHLREALWLRPDDVDAQKALEKLIKNGIHETLPEKIP